MAGVTDEAGAQLDRTQSALCVLQKLHRFTRTLPAGAALERILDEAGLLALAATKADGAGAGALLQAVDHVRQIAELGGNLADAADAIAEGAPLSTEIESLPLEPGRQDVVRVMNLHRVKGLEAPVVFLADPCSGFQFPPDVRVIRAGRLLVASVLHCGSLATALWVSVGRSPMDGVLCTRSRLLEEHRHGRAESETHVYLGARIMRWLFGDAWGDFCLRHSRYWAKKHGCEVSRLAAADKLAFVLTPWWLYLPMARATGELAEYMAISQERQAGDHSFTESEREVSPNLVSVLRAPTDTMTLRPYVSNCKSWRNDQDGWEAGIRTPS
ncbi:MAG: hypothetical protein ACRD7E_03120 [Bryobacteraceae bacterium]